MKVNKNNEPHIIESEFSDSYTWEPNKKPWRPLLKRNFCVYICGTTNTAAPARYHDKLSDFATSIE